ncbi:contactin-3-like [Dendronephthya gigantea]|uniref:contactin-3-like n=1 Tax=Dendronephthya gigantea TaxID=151771 RepID=UPI00106AEE68|nr:contactin-3-like [Dendronephthya gigantea]
MAFFCIRKFLGVLTLSNIIWILATITTVRGRRLPGLRFTTEPKDTAAVVGSTVELKCDAVFGFNVEPELSWVFNGSKVVLSNLVLSKTLDYNFSQKKRGNLRIENISDEAYGVYQCVAMASTGSIISRKARVRKSYLRMIPNQSSKRIVCSGSHPCILRPPDVVSFPEPSFAWKFRRHANESFIKIENSHDRSAEFVVSLDGVLVILEVNQSRQGEYNCTVTNGVETVNKVYDVVVDGTNETNKHPRLSILIKPQNITVVASSSASFDCISSEKNAQVKWLKGKTPIGPGEKFDISSPHRLTVKKVSLEDEGWYTCIISNISQKAYLDVRGAVKLTGFPHRKEVLWNEILILKSTANDGEIEWYFNAKPIHSFNGRRSSNTYNITRHTTRNGNEIVTDKQTLRVRGISKNQSGIYQVLANGFQSQDLKHTEVTFYDCGGKLTTDYGSISSPNSSEPHLFDRECVWVIKPERKRTKSILYLEILHFDGDKNSFKACLEIRSGETADSSILPSYAIQTPISSGLDGVFAFRLVFKFHASGKRCYGFNATYWVKEPTTPSITESTSQPTEPQTSETETAFTTKAISKIITDTVGTETSKKTPTNRISTKETHTTEKESEAGNVEKSSLKNNSMILSNLYRIVFALIHLPISE